MMIDINTMQYFYINQNSLLPRLQLECISDGRNTYNHLNELIQNSEITFTMVNEKTGVTKVAKAPCYLQKKETSACTEEFIICHDWKPREVNEKGTFVGKVNIEFGKIKNDLGYEYPNGNLIVPIRDDLYIIIK